MYLKSLVLKGFKSFADRSVLTLQPGITAIVGPNGSGKSNISDAVLWVLGERSAKNLRGQAMEDIIFSGSAARKAVSVAEVELVLDNSDHTVPVDFDEVVITRRMYRSGESEYLVNGVVSRRLDVLEILHDTGLGTGTHSIISQGSLDSILHSRPEDRRALIEEAAGVLKHKQRKEKSARKLAAMDQHLARVRDVAAEVNRQLGPLERKAKRAEAYKEVSAELSQLKLALAVDDLRNLQKSWDEVLAAEKTVVEEVEQRREATQAAEQKVSDFQELMRQESIDATELSRRQRRASSLAERLDSAEMLLRERRRSALATQADYASTMEGAAVRRQEAQTELANAERALQEAGAAFQASQEKQTSLVQQKSEADAVLKEIQEALVAISQTITEAERAAEEAKTKRDRLQETLASGMAQVKLIEAKKAELAADMAKAKEEDAGAVAANKEATEKLSSLEAEASAAQSVLTEAFKAKESAQEEQNKTREVLSATESEIAALEAALRTMAADEPALLWLLDNASKFSGGLSPLSRSIKVAKSLEPLVEALLGEDLAALAVEDAAAAKAVCSALQGQDLSGDVSVLIPRAASRDFVAAAMAAGEPANGSQNEFATTDTSHNKFVAAAMAAGEPLLNSLEYSPQTATVIEALLGDVLLFETREQAFAAWESSTQPLRYLSKDGVALWPTGKMRVFGAQQEQDSGMLARERRLEEAKGRLASAKSAFDQATDALTKADEALREAQGKSLTLSQAIAAQKGVCSACAAEVERTSKRVSAINSEIQDIESQEETAKKSVEELRPEMEALTASIATLAQQKTQGLAQREEKSAALGPAESAVATLAETLNETKLETAKLDERKRYSQSLCDGRKRDLQIIDEDVAEARAMNGRKAVAVKRGALLLEVLTALTSQLNAKARILEEAMTASETATTSVHSQASEAREAARLAHDQYDASAAKMASIRVEKSRLEVQVEAAVNAVVTDCHTPLDIADQLPVLENRSATEDEAFRLERRIKSMGTINPDAAEEYSVLKERYDFYASQLEDMEAARRSLNRIVRVIDSRMKDDFVRTFEEVNNNFNEIFSLLFPGGQAHLSLVDPDDIENSGVEVSAQPRGKRLTKMMLMSGGEKSLTALALLFAVYKTRTTPFYILDEVEAALDDSNLRRLMAYVDTLRTDTQLIMITHQRRTMEMADVLFGVSMQADGVTKVISQKLDRALEHAEEA